MFVLTYIFISLISYYGVYTAFSQFSDGVLNRSLNANLLIGFASAVILSKLIFAAFLLVQDSGRLVVGIANGIDQWIGNEDSNSVIPGRRKFLTLAATGLAAIPFASMLYGITKGKYQFEVNHLKLKFPDLPKAFEGFRIVQISDIHAGSFDCTESVQKGIQLIQDQEADMIVFTGDLVNQYKDEINPYIDYFKKLDAPFGKYAILGNHDYYGFYANQAKAASEKYWADFRSKFDEMGFDLLLNQNRKINKEGDSIRLLGVENWGSGRWFPKYGDLDKAMEGTNGQDFKILLSHDPTHWDEKVIPHDKHIHLTMSGHTHGMQFGINLPGFQWSPVKYRYKRWMGLYEQAGQFLYVNRGFGFLGFPGRVGMWPEISVLELQRAEAV